MQLCNELVVKCQRGDYRDIITFMKVLKIYLCNGQILFIGVLKENLVIKNIQKTREKKEKNAIQVVESSIFMLMPALLMI